MRPLFSAPSDVLLRNLTARTSVVVAAILILAKLIAFFKTGSIALLSSLIDSGVDLLASIITVYGVAAASRPPDKDHRFGHGKAEALAAIAQAAFIVGTSILLSIEAIQRFVSPQPLRNLETGYAVMGLAIFLTALLLALQSYTVARTKSLAIASDRLHYIGDILINLSVIATLYFQAQLHVDWIDPVFALFIAAAMVWGALRIGRKALDVLMDAELPEKNRKDILKRALGVAGVWGIHDLRTRFDGEHCFIEMHVEMDTTIDLKAAQNISEEVLKAVHEKYPAADVQIHQDPAGLQEERLDNLIEKNDM
ncbi:MAG TPA: divalent metal cation transporter FieF [Rhodospirillaceae bacterium]|nr:divalent metal cation transporter FieF [Rhodospirillaceae bacterium]